MDGNREEAIRVKVLAQNIMEKKDFLIEATADEATIKKQYRKFALHLHPDKNKFTGTSDAFNLIFRAQNVLLDRNMRLQYDLRLQAVRSKVRRVNHQAYAQSHVKRQPPYQNSGVNKFASQNNKQQQQQNNQSANDGSTFWTKCPHCLTLFMYYKKILGNNVACRNCNMNFTALENKSFSTSSASSTKPSSMKKEEAGIDLPKQASQSGLKYSYSKVELKKDVSDKKNSEPRNGITSVATDTSKSKREYSNVESTLNHPPDIGNSGRRILNKRKLIVPETSHSKMEFQKDSDEKRSGVEHGVNPTAGLVFEPKDGNSNVESTIKNQFI
ncbi:hypothetical protein LIER_12129 [Lithospermum erythrorhizon]|uniref:J domain-containing protein n=1 Tax=Lithospermum erythrorhizon TaxID=34254 RepID=A0AAV3PVS6_LITER